jgi:hypothetical protein
MRKSLAVLGLAAGLTVLATAPAVADTVTKTVVGARYTLTCVITYTELNGNNRIDLVKELFSISNVSCTVTRNT